MNPHFPILREPIKVRLVHGPTSWILGDDSPITCQCFCFIPVLSLLLLSIDVHWHIPTFVLRGGKPKTVGFWNHRPWLQLSIAYDQRALSPPPPEIRPQISPNQSKSSRANRLKRKGNKKVPTNTTVALAYTDLSAKMGDNKFQKKSHSRTDRDNRVFGIPTLRRDLPLSFSRGTKLVAKWFE